MAPQAITYRAIFIYMCSNPEVYIAIRHTSITIQLFAMADLTHANDRKRGKKLVISL